MLLTHLCLIVQVCNLKPTYRKSWAGNLLMWSHLALDPSFKVKRGQPNLKMLITCLLLVLEVCSVKATYRKSWAGNLLMCSDLTLDPFSRSKDGSLALVSCLSGGYKFASVLQCVGLVFFNSGIREGFALAAFRCTYFWYRPIPSHYNRKTSGMRYTGKIYHKWRWQFYTSV